MVNRDSPKNRKVPENLKNVSPQSRYSPVDPSIQHDPDQIDEEKTMDPTAKKYFALTQSQDMLKNQ
jgi:hypothetical protein